MAKKSLTNKGKIDLLTSIFKSSMLDRAYTLVGVAPGRLLIHPLATHYPTIEEHEMVRSSSERASCLTNIYIKYFNNYSSVILSQGIRDDLDMLVPPYKKRYRYKKKHINRFIRYTIRGLREASNKKKFDDNDHLSDILDAINAFKNTIHGKFIRKR